MPYKVLKSRLPANYAGEVAAFADELNRWARHMAKVGVDPEYVAHPRPTARPEIELAVSTGDDGAAKPSYEIVDDGEQVLREKKDALLAFVALKEHEALAKVVPIGKRRHLAFAAEDVRLGDAKRREELLVGEQERRQSIFTAKAREHADALSGATAKKAEQLRVGFPKNLSDALGPEVTEDDVAAHVEKTRPADATRLLEEKAERDRRIDAVVRHGAMLQHAVEDLTADSIGEWFDENGPRLPRPFPA